MRALRSMGATVLAVAGVLCLALWALATLAVRAVNDETTVVAIAEQALGQPAVTAMIADRASTAAEQALLSSGVDLAEAGLSGVLRGAVTAVVESDDFSEVIGDAALQAHGQVQQALTQPDRPSAPLTVEVDVSEPVNEALVGIPLVGAALPAVSIAPIAFEVMSAEGFDRVRSTYGWVDRLARWAGWVGLALIGLAALAAPRRRHLLTAVLGGLGVLLFGLWMMLGRLDLEAFRESAPSGPGKAFADAIASSLGEGSAVSMWLLRGAVVCLLLALVAVVVTIATRRKPSAPEAAYPS